MQIDFRRKKSVTQVLSILDFLTKQDTPSRSVITNNRNQTNSRDKFQTLLREANINYPIIRKRVEGRLIRVDKKGRFGSGRQTGEVWIGSTKKGRFGWGRQTGGLGRVDKKGEVWVGSTKRWGLARRDELNILDPSLLNPFVEIQNSYDIQV